MYHFCERRSSTMSTLDYYDSNILNFAKRNDIISTLYHRFLTYGYQQIRTSTFESYDLYSTVTGTIPQDEMIKVIDPSGKVLVLRPDVTIPITQEIAAKNTSLQNAKRYFYVLDVFRQSFGDNGSKERTQAGIEYFGEKSAAADAEVIALAIHALRDLGDYTFKIEIGHAGFFKHLASHLNLNDTDFERLRQYIQAKNMTEIVPFLQNLQLDKDIATAVRQIPILYGDPDHVLKQAKSIALNDDMLAELDHLHDVYQVLKGYGMENSVVFDLGLINHMNYYSDIIFQGFMENVSRPVLMGGRYDSLAEQFGASIPAIGFAYDIEGLLDATKTKQVITLPQPIVINYEKNTENSALHLANELRQEHYEVIVEETEKSAATPDFHIQINQQTKSFTHNGHMTEFKTSEELFTLLKEATADGSINNCSS